MSKIGINECVYSVHPVYDLYASDENGNIINIIKKVPSKGHNNHSGYMQCVVRKYGGRQKSYYVHRFVWECFNGSIPEGKVIDHFNNDKKDNRLCNLQLVTQQQNCKKSASDRDYSFVAKNHKNRKCVKAINITTKEVSYFYSMYAVQQHLQINAGIVKMACEGINRVQSGVSKKDGHHYKFEYVEQDVLPDNHIRSGLSDEEKSKYQMYIQAMKKSVASRPKMSDENRKKHHAQSMKKWQQKEYKCPRCDKILKNINKVYHNKKCK